jgi:hypothetical protein
MKRKQAEKPKNSHLRNRSKYFERNSGSADRRIEEILK